MKAPLFAALLFAAAPASAAGLLELYEQALVTSPMLKGREFAVDQAQAQMDQARSRLLPQITASGSLGWNELSQNQLDAASRRIEGSTSHYQSLRGVILARQALFDLPSWLSWQGAGAAVKQAEMELVTARMRLAADLIDRYFEALEAGDQLRVLEGEKDQTSGELKRMQRLHEKQLAPVTDLYETKAYLQSLMTREIELRNARAIALEKLRETAGVRVSEVDGLRPGPLPAAPGNPEQWVQEAEKNHPALMALQHAIDGTRQLIASSRAQHLPQLSLQASEIYADNGGFDNRQQGRYTIGTVGLQLNVPIFSGGATEAAVREAVARYQIATELRSEKLRQIERETRTAYLDTQAGSSRIEAAGLEVEARGKAEEAQTRSHHLGLSTIVDLLEAKKNLLKARFQQASARYDYVRALVALRLWAGTLTQADVAEINDWLVKADP